MKLRYFITCLIAGAALLAGCQKEVGLTLSEVQVDCSYVSIPQTGGNATVKVSATDAWSISVPEAAAKWLTVSPASGSAGEATVSFSAASALDGRTAEIQLTCGGKTQYINVIQGLPVISAASCKEIIAGPDGKNYKVTGICTKIANTNYGNWYINDGTGEVYIYGTVNDKGAYDWAKFNIEVGDEVTVAGPKTTYGTTVELVDAQFISVKKSLVKITNSDALTGAKEAGEVTVILEVKDGASLKFDVKDSWMGVKNIYTIPANSKEKTPELTAVVLSLQANEAGVREGEVEFTATKGKDTSKITATITQEGAITEVSIADFNAAKVGLAQYKVSGVITSIAKAETGDFYIKDATGELYVYHFGAKNELTDRGLKVGDIVTVIGTRDEYKGTIELTKGQYVEHKSVTKMTAAEAEALKDEADTKNPQNYVMLTGTVVDGSGISGHKFDLATYGNFELKDESGSVYVYGVSTGWNGETKKFGTLGVKEGDTITIIGYKTSYKGTNEIVGFYVSHEAAK